MSDTIFAPATPPGRGAVAVVRLSGPKAGEALRELTGRPSPPPRRATLRRLRDGSGAVIDQALVLWMPAPQSFTGEDSVELHLHGGPAVMSATLDALLASGLRPAERGEFTRRAFENGRLDLAQAEAVADLVEAESGGQLRQALAQLEGALSARYEGWRERLLDALAQLEAEVDFPDEAEVEGASLAALAPAQEVLAGIGAALDDVRGERVRDGFRVALVGAPNVGKSSLLNALAGRDAAIVTAIPGTTRDVVEVQLRLTADIAVLADTAGLRHSDDLVEAEGVRRARAWAQAADIRVGVVDCTRPETLEVAVSELREGDVLALNKRDLAHTPVEAGKWDRVETVASPDGVADLRTWLSNRLGSGSNVGEFPAATRARHRELLQEAEIHLRRAMPPSLAAELVAEDIRLALRCLERVTGRSNPEAVLDRVFAGFCIGK